MSLRLSGRVLVIADGDKGKANTLAQELGESWSAMRGKTMPEYLDIEAAVATARRLRRWRPSSSPSRPITPAVEPVRQHQHLARAGCAQCGGRAALGPIWDPVAVKLCFDAGVRRQLSRCAWVARPDRPPASRSMRR